MPTNWTNNDRWDSLLILLNEKRVIAGFPVITHTFEDWIKQSDIDCLRDGTEEILSFFSQTLSSALHDAGYDYDTWKTWTYNWIAEVSLDEIEDVLNLLVTPDVEYWKAKTVPFPTENYLHSTSIYPVTARRYVPGTGDYVQSRTDDMPLSTATIDAWTHPGAVNTSYSCIVGGHARSFVDSVNYFSLAETETKKLILDISYGVNFVGFTPRIPNPDIGTTAKVCVYLDGNLSGRVMTYYIFSAEVVIYNSKVINVGNTGHITRDLHADFLNGWGYNLQNHSVSVNFYLSIWGNHPPTDYMEYQTNISDIHLTLVPL